MTLPSTIDPPAPAQLDGLSAIDVMTNPALFGPQFGGDSWAAWRTVTKAIAGLPLDKSEVALFKRCTGRRTPPSRPAREAWLICGRRGGKSQTVALWAVFLASFRAYRLALGERGVVMVIAADRRQARVVFGYVRGLLRSVPMLETMIERETADSIDLNNGIRIEIHTASFRTLRGYTVVAAICDEVAYWRADDAANPDKEILAALRPALATTNGLLLVSTSPYARLGEVWRTYQAHHGHNHDPILVWRADTATMNPSIDPLIIRQAYEDDPQAAAAEWGAEFRKDIETFVPLEVVQSCVIKGRRELAPASGVEYVAFIDPSGGSSDSFTLAIAHTDSSGRRVVDLIRERTAPFSPAQVVEEFARVLHDYHSASVSSDRYAGEWPREAFRKLGIEVQLADKAKSDLYLALLPLLNSGQVELLDHPKLVSQLVGLERRVARGGRDSIDHAPGGAHDDVVNAVAGAVVLAQPRRGWGIWDTDKMMWTCDPQYGRETVTQFRERADQELAERAKESADEIREQVQKTGFWWPGEHW